MIIAVFNGVGTVLGALSVSLHSIPQEPYCYDFILAGKETESQRRQVTGQRLHTL